ncbi:MAG: hypothetical protein GSR85_02645 [Desulfurococcales archaeon]|nr:hypothetical protein [Desulfurococcales archaeon]
MGSHCILHPTRRYNTRIPIRAGIPLIKLQSKPRRATIHVEQQRPVAATRYTITP